MGAAAPASAISERFSWFRLLVVVVWCIGGGQLFESDRIFLPCAILIQEMVRMPGCNIQTSERSDGVERQQVFVVVQVSWGKGSCV